MASLRAQIAARLDACPVGFSVYHRGVAGLEVTKAPDARRGQGLDLAFRTKKRAVVDADVTAYGMTAQARMIATPLSVPEETTEDFVLKGTADEPLKVSSVWMKQLGTVSRVELTRVVFADGTAWTPNASSHCIARPSPLLLVGGQVQSR